MVRKHRTKEFWEDETAKVVLEISLSSFRENRVNQDMLANLDLR